MKILLSAGSLYTLPLPKIFELARDTGFDGVEVIINHDFQYGNNLEILEELQTIHPILSLHAPFLAIDRWGGKSEQLQKTALLALDAGVPLINFHPPSWLAMEWKFWKYLKSIRDFQSDIGRDEITITIENMPASGKMKLDTYMLGKTQDMIRFMQEHNLFMTFDTAHMGSKKTGFLPDFHQFYESGLIRNIHFSDYANGREHLLPGHGNLPLTRFLNHLRETGYDRHLTLELSPHEFPEGEEMIRATLKEIHSYLCFETSKRPALTIVEPAGNIDSPQNLNQRTM